jgi:hypothetical protein
MHPAKEGFSALPFFDEFDLSTVDVLLISQYVHLFYLHNIWNHGKHDWAFYIYPYEAGLFGSLLPQLPQWNTFPCIYMRSPIQFNVMHIFLVSLYPLEFRLRVPSPIHLSQFTNSLICIVSTLTILPPFHMFSARQTSKAEYS